MKIFVFKVEEDKGREDVKIDVKMVEDGRS